MTKNRKRVLVIGLDGFTWDLGRGFTAEGIMPNLARLVQDGCHGTLESVVPYETGPAWSSFQTGCYPVKTGIFAFHGYSKKTKQVKLNSFTEIKVPTIWELLSSEGKKVVSVNMPMTSPPPHVNGVIVPGLTCPGLSRETVHPPEIYDKYIKSCPNYRIVNKDTLETLLEDVQCSGETEELRCSLALELMKEVDWDLFCIQIQNTDAFQHRNWWALNPSAEGFTEESCCQAIEFYKRIDTILGKLIQATGESVLTAIVSDHGFCSQKAEIGINAWLVQNGYLHVNEEEKSGFKTLKDKLKEAVPPLKYLAGVYGNSFRYLKALLGKDKRHYELYSDKVVKHIRETIDLDKSLAFCLGGMGGALYLTDPSRQDEAKEMLERLMEAYGPDSSDPLIASIESLKDSCLEHADSLPDYMIHLMPGVEARINPDGKRVVNPGVLNGLQRGTHERSGVFVLHGPKVHRNISFDASIVDIVPTLLSFFSIPVPDHMDGTTLSEAFTETLNIQYQTVKISEKKDLQYSDTDQSIVEKQLEDLGYL